ncbi:hypothetical protein F3Y22_tig00110683pilonHSYRG00360 [Hibiscus syriacus]|uniref:BHLH domain-containing protein n=1 Tax=Hibiscus syriacus TaxID=106335 RepID=A0A6A2ZXH8_HIBSY|nr:hypothetical protein F3Y22_tig00110683pilonHSYRG00360 [Hibiscus syriacus]
MPYANTLHSSIHYDSLDPFNFTGSNHIAATPVPESHGGGDKINSISAENTKKRPPVSKYAREKRMAMEESVTWLQFMDMKRRERINERLRILQNRVPYGTKVDIITMLEEAVHYVKFLQLQIKGRERVSNSLNSLIGEDKSIHRRWCLTTAHDGPWWPEEENHPQNAPLTSLYPDLKPSSPKIEQKTLDPEKISLSHSKSDDV